MSAKRRPVSSSVLTVLASISAPYNGVDALPPFLYPYPPEQTTSSSISSRNERPLADRYQLEEDGRWRRVEDYTLYGSRVCSNCETIPPSPSATTGGPPEDFVSSLPTGWHTPSLTSSHRDSVVMALSIVLAIAICLLAITWFHYREKRIKRLRKADIELRPSSVSSNRRSQDLEVRSRLKAWASATARWRYNARYSARQRRGKRVTEILQFSSSQVNSRDALTTQHSQTSLTPTRTSSRISSRSSSASFSPTPTRSSTPSPITQTQSSADVLPESEFSPPAYHQPHQSSLPSTPAAEKSGEAAAPRYSSSMDPEITRIQSGANISYSLPLFHCGHAATDDKNVLAQFSSEPPTLPIVAQDIHSSAPEWRDEELSDFDQDLPAAPASSSSQEPAQLFPCPPPSHPAFHFPQRNSRNSLSSVAKGKMAMAYGSSYEVDPEEITQPSAPPFTESPFYSSLEASAPPAFSEDDTLLEPSAPSSINTYDFADHPSSRPASPALSDSLVIACSIPLPPDSPGDCRPLDSLQDPRPG